MATATLHEHGRGRSRDERRQSSGAASSRSDQTPKEAAMRNPLRPHNHFARAASAALAVLVCAGPAAPVAADDTVRRPTYDRAVLSKIAHDVLRRAVSPVESV